MDGSVVLNRRVGNGDAARMAPASLAEQARRSAKWTLHVRAHGRTWNLAGESTGIDPRSVDRILLAQLARRLQLAPGALDDHAVDRADHLVMVRPWAIWG
jgi:hypothetical protein